jgi:type II secretory pathway predicted ATPase ExeA/cell division septation protein DedD
VLTLFDHRAVPETALAPVVRRPTALMQPFGLSPDQRFIYRSDAYIWAFEQITTAVRQREGLMLVVGEPGTGKTLLCRTLLSRLSGRHPVCVVVDPCVRIEELLLQMLQDFGVMQGTGPHRLTRHDLVATLHRFLASLIPLNTTAILVIDEAQHLDPWVLEQLRLLSNCESDRAKLLQIILVGTPALEGVCRAENMHHLDQRIARRCRLTPLNREEVVEYIESRLLVASLPADEFTGPAANAIATFSGGNPRTVNLLCERSLDLARRRGMSPINTSIVRQAADQLAIPVSRLWFMNKRAFMNKRTAVVATVLLAGVPPVTWLASSQSARSAPAAAVASATVPASTTVSDRAVYAPAADIPVLIDDVTTGTLALADAMTIQVAAFRERDRAASVTQQLRGAGLPAFRRMEPGGLRHLVLVGPYVTDAEAQSALQILSEQGFRQTKVVREDAGTLLP